ncbi:MAG: VirB4 family type IV secretion system protein [Leptospirillia bacterium]
MWSKKPLPGDAIHRLFDFASLSGKTFVGHSGRLSRLLFLSGANIVPLDLDETLQLYRGIAALIGHLPAGYGLQFRVEFRHGTPSESPFLVPSGPRPFGWKEDGSGESLLAEDKNEDFGSRPTRKRHLSLAIIGYPDHERERLRLSHFPRGGVSPVPKGREETPKRREERLREIRQIEETVFALLPGAGMEGVSPKEEELLAHLASRANPGLLAVDGFREDARGPLPPLFQTTFQEFPGELKAYRPDGEVLWGRFHALRQLPAVFHRETLAPILEGPDFDCDLTLNLFKPDRSLASRSVQSNSTVNRFLTLLLPGKSYRLESVIAEQEDFLKNLHEGPEEESSPLLLNLTLGYWHPDKRRLSEMGQETLRAFSEADGALCAAEPYRQWPLFRSQFPADGCANDRWEMVTAAQAARFLPVWDRFPDMERPWFFAKNHRQELLALDFWSRELPNANGLVIGRSGSGKSFGVKMLLHQYFLSSPDHHAVIVENGGDFERMCAFFGGDYVRVDLSGNFSLNPFPLKEDLAREGGIYDPDWMGFLVALIETFLITAHPVTPLHRSILGQCLGDLYDRLPDSQGRPCLSDLVRTLFSFRGRDAEDEESSVRMAKTLESWSTGLYAPLFNNPQGFRPQSRLLAFDLSGLDRQEALRGIVFAFIAGLSLEKLFREKNRRLYFIYDEAHRLMTQFSGTGFLEHMYRTARKFGGGVVAMSQSPEDWLGESREGGILGNSSWKWIFPCSVLPETYRKIGLTEREGQIIDSLDFARGDFSECYLSMGRRRGILRLEPSPLEYWMAARSPEEDRLFATMLEEKGSVKEALLALARKSWQKHELEEG